MVSATHLNGDGRLRVHRVDYETDAVIQKSLRERVANGVTLLTVAYRLQTVMDYDKIVSGSSIPRYVPLTSAHC